ncbi:hypothetical protein CR513_48123, partial [Mucuna pruriens]
MVGIDKVGNHSLPTIEYILYVDGTKCNLLSISKFYDSGINLDERNNKKIGHINLKTFQRFTKKKHLVKGLLKISHKTHLLNKKHLYLFGRTRTLSLGGKSDHENEFENVEFKTFYENNGIFINFSSSRTPQQNWIRLLMNYEEEEYPIYLASIHLDANQLGKFDHKVNKGIFLGYFDTSKAYIVFNFRTLVVEESIQIKFNDGLTFDKRLSRLKEDFIDL